MGLRKISIAESIRNKNRGEDLLSKNNICIVNLIFSELYAIKDTNPNKG